ncbi:LolA-like outer membrane lipoprotein chaperone [Helicobacter sp. 11S02596-1]|uniref:LolA-like outer membrane lipoprotein chaperone n=1 Tax=Helicobacter sp. 11S02596-1 TaxID=1476194 RepID=UPI000BA74826|nr:LolA-like outer membrane lipoprotein chaperone [Helicobacter sp. 11S02596-1]PAF41644.1 hypothetical protein BJI48_08125 [Helicobacter sp. 11S02596-1]
MWVLKALVLLVLSSGLYGAGEGIKSFWADFVQSVATEDGGKIFYQGSIEAKVPDFAKWTYVKPLKKEIYINAQNVVIYEPNLYQATITHLEEKTDFFSIIKGAVLQKDGRYRSVIGKISYFLTFKDKKPDLLEFQDEFGNEVSIKFKNVRLNIPLKDSDFVFVPGDNIDIIQQ